MATARDHVARLNADGSLDVSFNAAADSDVYDIAEQADGKIIIVGSFGRVNNTPQVGVARLNPDGTLDEVFNIGAGAGGQVFSVDIDPDGKIVIGGFFTAFNNIQRKYVARLNPDGSVDTTFDPGSGAGFTVFSVACQPNGRVIVAGDFETFGGQIRRGIVRLRANGLVDNSFNPIITRNGYNRPTLLKGLIVPDSNDENRGKLFLGGRFTNVNGFSRIGVARMTLNFSPGSTPFDFDSDGKTDIGIFRPGPAEWWYQRSSDGQVPASQFGATTDKIVPGDYTGDGKADIAFWRPSTGFWYVIRSEDNSFFAFPFGQNGDVPVPADYDADGKFDTAVFRPSNSTWFIPLSGGGGTSIFQFGITGDQPVVADYDGDAKADVAIFRPGPGEWWIQRSTAGILAFQFGASTDKPVQGDYTGDGKADAAFWRPSNGFWYIIRSEDFSFFALPFGQNGDIVAPGDYDGDGKFDLTVLRPAQATWFIQRTTAGTQIVQFGINGDRPIANAFVP